MLEPILKIYPLETMRPGDVYWFNDPYISDGAVQHHQDMVFTAPIFHEGSPIAFATTFGHYQDIGGLRAGSISPHATEIYHEGVLVPPVRIVREGQLNDEAYRIFLRNSRLPDLVEGDTRAMMASCRLADTRVAELCGRYGAATVLAAFDECIAQTAVRARELFLQLVPQGRWSFHDFLDSDGGADQRPFRIELELSRTGDHVRLDGSRSDDQARGPINFTTNTGLLRIAFGRYLQSLDADLDVNEGLLRNLDEWIAREGSILKPRFPAPLGMRANTRFRVMSCIFGSLAQANGGRVPAACPSTSSTTSAWDEGARGPSLCIEGPGRGLGARPFADGVDVIYCIAQENYPVEYVERDFPLRVERYAVRPDSGGPGLHLRRAAASSATCACSARRRSWPRAWRTRWSRPTAEAGGRAAGPGASRSTPARRRRASSWHWATASASSVAISSALRPAAAAAGAIRSSVTPSACRSGARLHHRARGFEDYGVVAGCSDARYRQDGHGRGAPPARPRPAAYRPRSRLRRGRDALARPARPRPDDRQGRHHHASQGMEITAMNFEIIDADGHALRRRGADRAPSRRAVSQAPAPDAALPTGRMGPPADRDQGQLGRRRQVLAGRARGGWHGHGRAHPTLGLFMPFLRDPEWAVALSRAYNTMLYKDVTSQSPRLRGVALLPLQDPAAAARELERCVGELGFVGGMLSADSYYLLGHSRFDPIYAAAQRLRVPITVHAAGTDMNAVGHEPFPKFIQAHTVSHVFAQLRQITSMMFDGVPVRFPDLSIAYLEAGAGWIPYFLQRMDEETRSEASRRPSSSRSRRARSCAAIPSTSPARPMSRCCRRRWPT